LTMNISIVISSLFTIIAISAGLLAIHKANTWSAKKDEELKIELDKIDLEFQANSDTLEKIPEDRRDDAIVYFDTKESTKIWGENELTFKIRF